jgi:hypothetical protein
MKVFYGQHDGLEVSSGDHPRVRLVSGFEAHGGRSRTSPHSKTNNKEVLEFPDAFLNHS